jgi:hypothetical protein
VVPQVFDLSLRWLIMSDTPFGTDSPKLACALPALELPDIKVELWGITYGIVDRIPYCAGNQGADVRNQRVTGGAIAL